MTDLVCYYLSQDMACSDMVPLSEVIDRCIEDKEQASAHASVARDRNPKRIVRNDAFTL